MSKKSKAEERTARAAAAREAQRAAERRRTIRSVTVVVLAMVLVVGVAWFLVRSQGDAEVSAAPAGDAQYGVTMGDPDAPHTVVVYEDFLCPFCGQLEAASSDDLKELAAEGSLLVEYRPFELLGRISDYSARATNAFAVVLEEAGPEVAVEFHDLLFENQPSEEGPFPDNEALLDLAVEAGAEEDAVSEGILEETMSDWVDEATQAALDAGVQGTPTVILDGEVLSGDVDELVSTIRETAEGAA